MKKMVILVTLALAALAALVALDWHLKETCAEWCREHPLGPCCTP